jgi:hypothetical protein
MSDTPTLGPTWRERVGGWAAMAAAAVPLALTVVAEAAWITIVARVVNEYFLRQAVLDIPVLALFVVVGVAASRQLAPSLGRRWPVFTLFATIAAALVGVLWAPDARAALDLPFPDGLTAMLGANPGGLLAGVAFLRGVAWGHAGLPLPEDKLIRLVGGGLIVIALAAVAGALATEPWRATFLAGALIDGLVFAGSALLALAFTRQAIAAGDVAAGWQRNPIWVVTLLVAVVTLVILAVAVSGQVKPTLELIVAALIAPIAVIGLMAGWTKRGLRVFMAILIGAVVFGSVGSAIVQLQQAGSGEGNGVGVQASAVDTAVTIGVAGSVLVLAVVVVLVLVRLWMRRLRVERSDVVEERYVDRSEESEVRPRRRRRLGFGRKPADAVAAYRALLADLSDRNGVRREVWETPHEHAERLRQERLGSLPLNLLAADYALAEFGEVELTPAENRRAVSRWRLLRRRLQATPESEEELSSSL